MLRNLSGVITVAASLLLATATFAPPAHGKRHDSSLARLWLFAWLSFARTDRMGAGAKSRSGFLLGCPTGILPRALEWRWLRSLLDADADRADVELRSIVDFGQKWPLLQSNEATDG